MTCRDCIHYDLCVCVGTRRLYPGSSEGCRFFAEKNRFIELPCKIDDYVFIIIAGKILPFSVISISIHINTPTFKAQHGTNLVWVFGSYDVGKTVFLTREEAEAALAKMGGKKDG